MRTRPHQRNSLILRKLIFPLLFLFLAFGDWHLHAESAHPCETSHSAMDTDMKWHPHGACEETDTHLIHDDLSDIILTSKSDQMEQCEPVNAFYHLQNNLVHFENGHDCHTPLFIHTRLCVSTILLI